MRFKTLLWIAAALSTLSVSACDEKGKDTAAVSQMRITVKARRNGAGVNVPFVFSATDQFKLLDVTAGSTDIKNPLNSGNASSLFLFSLSNAQVGDLLVATSPVDADVTVEGKKVAYRIPENQDGSDVVCPFIGWTAYSGDAYNGDAVSAESRTAVIRASIQKGSYSIVKAVLKANGGEKIAGKVTVDTETNASTPTAASWKDAATSAGSYASPFCSWVCT